MSGGLPPARARSAPLPAAAEGGPSLVVLSRLFRVLSDPTRLRIIELLSDGERSVGELVTATGVLQPRLSTHLACLRHCGLAEAERRGREMVYHLSLDRLRTLLELAASVAGPRAARLASCTRIGPDWI